MRLASRAAREALFPIKEMMEREMKQSGSRLLMDETPIPILRPGKGETGTSYFFATLRDDRSYGGNKPPIVVYSPSDTRAMYKIHDNLAGFDGIVQTDAYPGYGQLGKDGTVVANIVSPKCLSHARRYFTDEYAANKTEDAKTAIGLFAELYAEEAKIRGKPPHVRQAHRREFSLPIVRRLEAFLTKSSKRHLKKSGMAKAIRYAQNHWDNLVLFVDDGRIDLDTNAVERMFKPIILLRKNALFIGSDEGAQAWAILASIVETCKLNNVNVEPYLKWVLDQMAAKLPRSDYDKLLPWNAPSEFLITG